MCGRCRQNVSTEDLIEACSAQLNANSSSSSGDNRLKDVKWRDEKSRERHVCRENVSPGYRLTVLKEKEKGEGMELISMVWGLVPSYVKTRRDINHWRMFNARSETVLSNGVFSRLTEKQRCAIPLNGFYEWQALGNGKKQPFYLNVKKKGMTFAAGLYDVWIDRSTDERLYTFTILTMDACSSIFHWLHERQPVLLNTTSALRKWINCADVSAPMALKEARAVGAQIELSFNPVTHRMTNPKYQGKDCSRHVDESSSSIKKWFTSSSGSSPCKVGRNETRKKRSREISVSSSSPKTKKKKEGVVVSTKKKKGGIERFFSISPKK